MNNVLNCFLVPDNQHQLLEKNSLYSSAYLANGLKYRTMCWKSEHELMKFMTERGVSSAETSTQSCITLETPDGRRFLLTSKFVNRPFPHDDIVSDLIVQVSNTVYWLDRDDPTKVLGTFQLSQPLKFYHDASICQGVLSVRYVRKSDIVHADPYYFDESELLTETFQMNN